MAQIALQLKDMQVNKVQTKQRYSDWRSIVAEEPAKPSYAHGNDMMATSLVTVLLDCLFGGGFFSSMGGLGDVLHGAAQMGGMEATTRPTHKPVQNLERQAEMNEQLNKMAYQRAMSGANGQNAQMQLMQQMIAMLLMNMLSNQQGSGEGKTGGSKGQSVAAKSDVVPGAFCNGTSVVLSQLKQNRQSICCIRTMFQRSADIITPKFETLKYA